MSKGIAGLYDKVCQDLGGVRFFEWIQGAQTGLVQGQLCNAVAWYVKRKRWFLEEHSYNPRQEDLSTWYAKELAGSFPPPSTQNVMKYFELEKDERLITTNSKVRPVILLQRHLDDWWNPSSAARHVAYWLSLPLFTYKDRHGQGYVLEHQRLKNPCVFYIPALDGRNPGAESESAARLHALQVIPEDQLSPVKLMCNEPPHPMRRPYRLSDLGLKLVLYHFYRSAGCLSELQSTELDYDLFKGQVNAMMDKAVPVP